MLTVAYLANQFPSPVEPYVVEEIEELRRRGIRVVPGTVRKAGSSPASPHACQAEIILQSVSAVVLLQALALCVWKFKSISPLLARVLFCGNEGPITRMKALVHTWLGACYAVLLQDQGNDHIHVHHGYFGSWIAMVAAQLLGVGFSLTLHGSDLLLHGSYLDAKLMHCAFCLTISEYNRLYILRRYPTLDASKVVVARLGAESPECALVRSRPKAGTHPLTLLAVGRLHAVKDHSFLIRACARLKDQGVDFRCSIVGAGPERRNLEALIRSCGLEERVALLGHVARESVTALYDRADVVVLTSRSEGIPLVLMEAMARGSIVLAPAITGIPELVIPDKTGFLYQPGSLDDFVARLLFIRSRLRPDCPDLQRGAFSAVHQLDWVRHAARVQIRHNFNRSRNLKSFGDLFVQRIGPQIVSVPDENFVLQQIQLSLQRNRGLPLRTDGTDACARP